ncbi:6933_t:CDS:2, partial [Paraglomus occultum]
KLSAKHKIIKQKIRIAKDTVALDGFRRINEHYNDYHVASTKFLKRKREINDNISSDTKISNSGAYDGKNVIEKVLGESCTRNDENVQQRIRSSIYTEESTLPPRTNAEPEEPNNLDDPNEQLEIDLAAIEQLVKQESLTD